MIYTTNSRIGKSIGSAVKFFVFIVLSLGNTSLKANCTTYFQSSYKLYEPKTKKKKANCISIDWGISNPGYPLFDSRVQYSQSQVSTT